MKKICTIKENTWLAKAAAKKMRAKHLAIVFNKTIHLYGITRLQFIADKELMCHELTHVLQYQRHGIFVFLVRYIWEWLHVGYYNISFEKEARANESNIEMLNKFEFRA